MTQDKERIEQIIKGKGDFNVKIRTIACKTNNWSKEVPYKEAEDLIFKSNFIDGVKLLFRYTTLTLNARHKFF